MNLSYTLYSAAIEGSQAVRHVHDYGASISPVDCTPVLEPILTAFTFCVIQLSLFCFIRPKIHMLYQPRCSFVPKSERVENPGNGYFSWFSPVWNSKLLSFLACGLDAYFFLRFIAFMLLFFLCCGALNMAVLIPIHLSTTKGHRATTLRRMSVSLSEHFDSRFLNSHFACAILTIASLHLLLIKEMKIAVKIRTAFMGSLRYRHLTSSKVVLFSQVPLHMRDYKSLESVFKIFPGGIERVWFIDDFRDDVFDIQVAQTALELLESHETKRILGRNRGLTSKCYPPYEIEVSALKYFGFRSKFLLPSTVSFVMGSKKHPMRQWCLTKIQESYNRMANRRISTLNHKNKRLDKVFVKFRNQYSARMAHQCLLFPGKFGKCLIDVNPSDIFWPNLLEENDVIMQVRYFFIRVFLVCTILSYVIPVSVIGFLSQSMAHILSYIKIIKHLPAEIRGLLAGCLPSFMLNALTTFQLKLIENLLGQSDVWTGCEFQILLQHWYFISLFIHQFLIVSISTSVTRMTIQILERPITIPALLAANLPEGALFFYRHLAVKALTICGTDFLRIGPLLKHMLVRPLTHSTPRKIFQQVTTIPSVKWGLLYAFLSVYGIIGLTYCIISPLISALVIFVLFVVFLFYKYALQFVFQQTNPSETYGRLYFHALSRLYWGLYCLQFSLFGFLFNLFDQTNARSLAIQRLAMITTFMVTVFLHSSVVSSYSKYFDSTPVVTAKHVSGERGKGELDEKLLYLHPCHKWEVPQIWLPKDDAGIACESIEQIEKISGGRFTASTTGAVVAETKWSSSVHIFTGAP